MGADLPDVRTARTALQLATRAPSVHNTQPWRWRLGEDSLHLYSDPDLQLSSTDPDGRDFTVSCGIVLHHCVVAFAALGWRAKVRRFPDPANMRHLAIIELESQSVTQVDIALAEAISQRQTDRRHYDKRPVPIADIGLMGARAARMGVMLRVVEDLTHLRILVAQAAARHASSYDYCSELTRWSGRYDSHAGVPARSTPRFDPAAAALNRVFAGPALAAPPSTELDLDGAVVVVLGTAEDDELARLRAGEATSVVLLSATALGLATCPITEPLEISEIRDQVRADVFGASGFPQMLLRIGWPPPDTEPLPFIPRRPLSDVVTRLDGTRFE